MGELDRSSYFMRGLLSSTHVPSVYEITLEYDRLHNVRGKSNRSQYMCSTDHVHLQVNFILINQLYHCVPPHAQENDPEPTEIDSGFTRHHFLIIFWEIVEGEEISTSAIKAIHPENKLVRKQGIFNGTPVTIMFDSGATYNVLHPGLVQNMTHSGIATIVFDRYKFCIYKSWNNHWALKGRGLKKYQPQFNRQSHDILFPYDCVPSMSSNREPITDIAVEVAAVDFERKAKIPEYDEVYLVKKSVLLFQKVIRYCNRSVLF
ncbi:hypothetical protein CCR75_008445 [Bremia lactucae]|uniref:Uncharacterized protein n=1 Tax=Bremia lactucae TaxID=4779 RepID=A0A976FI55_BRELC|nr:hypothetical protein CCR75_008445 [Bremia lactucae]